MKKKAPFCALIFVIVSAVVFATGCPPVTPIRRAALVPRPTAPAHSGAPIGGKGLKAFGQMNTMKLGSSEIQTIEDLLIRIPTEGAAGVWIPTMQFGGGIYGAPNEYVSIGAQGVYTNLEMSEPNVIGVPEFPPEHADEQIIMGGPGVRVNVPIEEVPVTPAFIFEANLVTIPQAVYLCVENCSGTIDAENPGGPVYEFQRLDRESFILPTAALHVTVSPIEYVHVVLMGGAQRGVKNIGFDPDINNLDNHTLEGYFYGFGGGGVEGRFEFFYITALLSGAFGQPQEIRFGPSLAISAGVVLN